MYLILISESSFTKALATVLFPRVISFSELVRPNDRLRIIFGNFNCLILVHLAFSIYEDEERRVSLFLRRANSKRILKLYPFI